MNEYVLPSVTTVSGTDTFCDGLLPGYWGAVWLVNCVTGFLDVVTTVVTGNGDHRRLLVKGAPKRVKLDATAVRLGSPAATALLVLCVTGAYVGGV